MRREPPAGRSTFLLTKAKQEILRLLAEYFCATTNGLAELRYGTPNESQLRAIRRTLLLLHREGLVARLPFLDLTHAAGGFTYVYGLSEKGVRQVLAENACSDAAKPFGEHSARTLDHELAITAFHRAAARFADARSIELYWLQRNLKRVVHPDAVFALTDPRKPEDRNTRYYFLEIERAKLGSYADGEPQLLRKLRAYARHWGTRACRNDWRDFSEFQVVAVLGTAARARALAAHCRSLDCPDIFLVVAETHCHPEGLSFLLP